MIMNSINHMVPRALPALLLIILMALLSGCQTGNDPLPGGTASIPADAPDDETWSTTILFTDSTIVKAKLRVGHARRYISRMETLLDSNVYVEFYGRDGTLSATLVADSARIDDRTKDMVAYGNVHVESDVNRTTVDTDRLHWSNERRLLHSDAYVKIVDQGRGRTLEGRGFESDESLQNYKIYNASGRTIQN